MEDNITTPAELDVPGPSDGALLALTSVSWQQKERLRIDGCDVVATGQVLAGHDSTIAIQPFPKSKTGFTIEIQLLGSNPPRDKAAYDFLFDGKTNTYRHIFRDYPGVTLFPQHMANYRGRKVMGIVSIQTICTSPRIWCLAYTLFYAPKSGDRRH
ncbi:MAG TPA: hypothetical protein VFQ69_12030 [Rhizomicrobium sp.]|nr:hypothetical protein [Rhizomicrobium sp.]